MVRSAELGGGVVEEVTAWEFPLGWGWDPATVSLDLEANASQILDNALDDALGSEQPVEIRRRVVQNALLEAAEGAGLGGGELRTRGLAGALLGLLSQHVVQHARRPVVIMRNDTPATAQRLRLGSGAGRWPAPVRSRPTDRGGHDLRHGMPVTGTSCHPFLPALPASERAFLQPTGLGRSSRHAVPADR
ncbi:hypothetical protein [Streptomyces sp. NPDC004376]